MTWIETCLSCGAEMGTLNTYSSQHEVVAIARVSDWGVPAEETFHDAKVEGSENDDDVAAKGNGSRSAYGTEVGVTETGRLETVMGSVDYL